MRTPKILKHSLYQVQSFLAWRQDLTNVGDNPTTETPFWNAGSWGLAKP
jgi:hypothetical protein